MHISPYSFREGLRDGLPIALGYLSVSFGFGISSVGQGLSWRAATLISLVNLTSAGQVAGVAIIAALGSLGEMALAQLVINIRYLLMSIALGQRLDDRFSLPHRFFVSFGITDEIFAVASSKAEIVGPRYMYGLILLPVVGWTLGTLLGGVAGEILPAAVNAAMGIAIYAMFVAIVIPQARADKGVLLCAALAAALSCCMRYVPALSRVSGGFAVIICAVIAASAASCLFPVTDEAEQEAAA